MVSVTMTFFFFNMFDPPHSFIFKNLLREFSSKYPRIANVQAKWVKKKYTRTHTMITLSQQHSAVGFQRLVN